MRIKKDSGDTIIEVMLAFAVIALVAAAIVGIMNLGVATAQRSLEVTLVRQQIDGQAELLRFVHKAYIQRYDKKFDESTVTDRNSYVYKWNQLRQRTLGSGDIAPFGLVDGRCRSDIPKQAFIMNTNTGNLSTDISLKSASERTTLPPYALVDGGRAYGMYIQAQKVIEDVNTNTTYIDFHIRACWDAPGVAVPVTLGTIVRLYEPR